MTSMHKRLALAILAMALGAGLAAASDPVMYTFTFPTNNPPTVSSFTIGGGRSRLVVAAPTGKVFTCDPITTGYDTTTFECNNNNNGFCQNCYWT